MQNACASARRPTMIYWTSPSGTICRAESENADLVSGGDGDFAAPYTSTSLVGNNLFQYIDSPEVCHLYRALTRRVLTTGQAINFAYRCDSPTTRREMTMRLSRDAGMIRYESALIRETVREWEIPRETPDAETFVAICSFCQNYRFPVTSKVWKELEGLMMEKGLPEEFKFTHGVCREFYEIAMGKLKE
jgi:hypothetical protein